MSIEPMMPSNHLIFCCPLLLLPSIFPSIRVFSNESALCIRWPKYWSFSVHQSVQWTIYSFPLGWLTKALLPLFWRTLRVPMGPPLKPWIPHTSHEDPNIVSLQEHKPGINLPSRMWVFSQIPDTLYPWLSYRMPRMFILFSYQSHFKRRWNSLNFLSQTSASI